MIMYLFILEDGDILKSSEFGDDDKAAADAGILDVIALHTENPKQYFDGGWHDIKKAENTQQAGEE